MPVRLYHKDAQLADAGMCSDVDIEKVICAANARAHDTSDPDIYSVKRSKRQLKSRIDLPASIHCAKYPEYRRIFYRASNFGYHLHWCSIRKKPK